MECLPHLFYQRNNVTTIARQLIGKKLTTVLDGHVTSGLIVETEAYSFKEKGCHAFNNKLTNRNKVMFEAGGVAYVYLCYGIHSLLNVVTGQQGRAEAVLIRAIQPLAGQEFMLHRMKLKKLDRITSGPGKLTKALGITHSFNGSSVMGPNLFIDAGPNPHRHKIIATTRIGIDYAGADALLPWRFYLKDNEWVSKW
ncbi:MAG: DNA-3-methyladenine glycosylase [Cytophagales bacterium]|nr:DNA-3-methyladenine glycosylase [Cytophagales bacterium]